MSTIVARTLCLACGLALQNLQALHADPTEDDKLQALFQTTLDQSFRQQPLNATGLGDHRFDRQLDDISPEARAGWRAFAQQTLDALSRDIAYAKLSPDGKIDFQIWKDDLTAEVWRLDNLESFSRDPRIYGHYLNDSVYLLVAQSTQPKETNVANAIARMAEMPRIVAEAERSLTHPSKPLLETAIRQNQGAIHFYQKDLFQYVGSSDQQSPLAQAAQKIVTLLQSYQAFLEGPIRERAQENWRLGPEKFSQKFQLEMGIDLTADRNLADAEAEYTRVHHELYVVARQLWPLYFPHETVLPDDDAGRHETIARVIHAVSQEHGDQASMVEDVKTAVAGIKTFIRDKDYLRLPDPDRCEIIEMPEFRRGNSLAYLDNAPPLDPQAPSFYAVSPPPADWTPDQKRSFLEEYNRHMLQVLTIHEAYPGHYVQLAYANRQPSLIRRVLASGPYVEGWAVFGEITMLNEGYGAGDLRLRLMQLKFYLRAVVNSILDYKMHCTAMSDEEAMKLLVDGAFQSDGEAKLKVIRAKQSSVQLSVYFVGRMAHYRLRQSIERELGPAFDLGRYHEAVLSVGSIPPKFMPELIRARLAQPR